MSLDVYLTLPGDEQVVPAERIFVRRAGANVEVTREEWDEMYPDREPHVATMEIDVREVFEANITHNMGRMAGQCEQLYEALWRPDEIGITYARQLIEPLTVGLDKLIADRERLQEFNPENGWGNYDLLVRFTENYLDACKEWPDAEVNVSR